ncbi:MAG: hypothetical protein Q8N05_05995 [Bacteroidota bacterium]|nr:hypothetical protein [Bacteroidota bacterium]
MKNLLGLLMLLVTITMLYGSPLQAEVKNKSLIGEWVYQVSVTREKNKLTGKVDTPEGPKMLSAIKK